MDGVHRLLSKSSKSHKGITCLSAGCINKNVCIHLLRRDVHGTERDNQEVRQSGLSQYCTDGLHIVWQEWGLFPELF